MRLERVSVSVFDTHTVPGAATCAPWSPPAPGSPPCTGAWPRCRSSLARWRWSWPGCRRQERSGSGSRSVCPRPSTRRPGGSAWLPSPRTPQSWADPPPGRSRSSGSSLTPGELKIVHHWLRDQTLCSLIGWQFHHRKAIATLLGYQVGQFTIICRIQ